MNFQSFKYDKDNVQKYKYTLCSITHINKFGYEDEQIFMIIDDSDDGIIVFNIDSSVKKQILFKNIVDIADPKR